MMKKRAKGNQMDWDKAIKIMAGEYPADITDKDERSDLKTKARLAVYEDVCSLVDHRGGEDDDGGLYDWLASGSYEGNETASSIAAEWDELCEQEL
jgi:hypothetical protein